MTTKRAIELDWHDLDHWVSVTDYRGEITEGRLEGVELSADPCLRVVARVATREPTEGGGHYWASFSSERFLSRDSGVIVGDVVGLDEASP
jgi:hypothetical protein